MEKQDLKKIHRQPLSIMSPEKNLNIHPTTPGLSTKMRGLFLEEEECLCSWRCGDSEHQHQAGHGHHLRDGAEDKKYELFPEMDSVPMDDHQSLDEHNDECLCSVHCSGRAAHSGEQNNDDLEAGIKYCPSLEPQLPTYHHKEYKPRSSGWKFTIFKPSSSYQAEGERKEFQGGEDMRGTGRRGGGIVTGREGAPGGGGVKTLILDWEERVGGGGEGQDLLLPGGNIHSERRRSQNFVDTLRKFQEQGEGDSEKIVTAKPMLSFASICNKFNSHTSATEFQAVKRKINFSRNNSFSGVVGRGGLPLADTTANRKRKTENLISGEGGARGERVAGRKCNSCFTT